MEIQLAHEPGFPHRLTYYTAAMLTSHLYRGQPYDQAAQAISVAIVDFTLFDPPYDAYHHRFRLRDPSDSLEFTDIFEVNILELPKLPQTLDHSLLWKWLRFIAATTREELDMAAATDPAIADAVQDVLYASDETSLLWAQQRYELAQHDQDNREYYARMEGAQEKQREIARGMLGKGLTPEETAAFAQLPLAEVNELMD